MSSSLVSWFVTMIVSNTFLFVCQSKNKQKLRSSQNYLDIKVQMWHQLELRRSMRELSISIFSLWQLPQDWGLWWSNILSAICRFESGLCQVSGLNNTYSLCNVFPIIINFLDTVHLCFLLSTVLCEFMVKRIHGALVNVLFITPLHCHVFMYMFCSN